MAREFSTSEIIRQKCSICGSKNKIYTDLVSNKKHVGFTLTCCNCGHEDVFVNNDLVSKKGTYKSGESVCIHVSPCDHKTCKYYGKYSLKDAAEMITNLLNGIDIKDNNSNNNETSSNKIPTHVIENSDSNQLVINGCKCNPKFH